MHQRSALLTAPALAGILALGLLALQPAAAQPPAAVETSESALRANQLQTPLAPGFENGKVPQLYDGELEDLGPQYVLLPKPKHQWVNFLGDFQIYRSDNATLAPSNRGASDISVATAQVVLQGYSYSWKGIQIQPRLGFRYQSFWYGLLNGQDHPVGTGLPTKDNDFMTYTPFGEALLQSGNILGSVGLRYSAFTNHTPIATGTFYQEWAPYWLVGYQWTITKENLLLVQYDGDYRFTVTNTGGLQPSSWNDRTDHAFSLIFNHIIGAHWVLQPSYRFQWSDYTATGRSRNDIYNTLSMVAAYYFTDTISARVFTSYEWRSSSELGNNYQNWNLGGGLSGSVAF